jgi:SAM-dependent methyltransferase
MSSDPVVDQERYSKMVLEQIRRGVIVCPETREKLSLGDDGRLVGGGGRTYQLLDGRVPILIADYAVVEKYAASSERMNEEYAPTYLERQKSWLDRLRSRDDRTPESVKAQASILANLSDDAVCLSVGGGPSRADARYVNLNIGPFPNVDVVGDAHRLPYADDSVDAIFCNAVFEHLHTPTAAALEIFRVLKRNGKAFVCTPFLQPYHGYPYHYQNFTLTGHCDLFRRAGLTVVEAGPSVGPTYTLRNMIAIYIANYAPFPLDRILRALWAGVSYLIAPLDVILTRRSNAHIMASTTYLIAQKT